MGQSIKLSLKERMIVVVLIRHRDNCVKRRGTCIALLFGESQGGLFVFFCRSPRMCPRNSNGFRKRVVRGNSRRRCINNYKEMPVPRNR